MGTYPKSKGRGNNSPPFVKLDHKLLEHPNYVKLTPYAIKLLIDLVYQYRGKNNGDLCAAFSVLKRRGWRSSATLHRAICELLHYEFISVTRKGGKHKASLYALTWLPIDYCGGKMDVLSNKKPSNRWQQEKPIFKVKKQQVEINSSTPNMNQCTPYVNQS